MIQRYLNKKVNIYEKRYSSSSTIRRSNSIVSGVVTAVDDKTIELDNKRIILIKHIYMIELAE